MRLRRFLIPVIVVLMLGACASEPVPSESAPSDPAPTTDPGVATIQEVVSSTAQGGDARIEVVVRARMPEDFDDGLPRRRFFGRGILDQSIDVAGVTYRLGPVPNAGGYFGQADGKTSVFYAQDGFTLSFPVLADALADPIDWLKYEPDDFSDPEIQRLGIGQLREIGLADPRFALALLGGGVSQLPAAATSPEGEIYTFQADVPRAAMGAAPALQPTFLALRDLGLTFAQLELLLDDDGRVRRLGYSMAYPPASGSRDVRLQVEIEFLEYGLEGDLSLPPRRAIADYEEFLAR